MTESNINLNIVIRRIYGLTRALLEMAKYLQYSRLYFQWKLWYKKNNSEQCVKVSHFFLLSVWFFYLRMIHVTESMTISAIYKWNADVSCFRGLDQKLFCVIGHSLWSPREQIRFVLFPTIGQDRHRAHPSSSVCLWRSLGLRGQIHVLSACSANV